MNNIYSNSLLSLLTSKFSAKFHLLLMCLFVFLTPMFSFGQAASSYCFTASSGTYSALTGTTDTSLGNNTDDGTSSQILLPYTFDFGGVGYNRIVVSSNGWLSFANTSETYYSNSIDNATNIKPALFPLWDDLKNTDKPRYVTTGTTPNRIFKIEWNKQKWDYNSSGAVISFQIWLFETSNVIEYIYKREGSINGTGSATIGIYDAANTYLTLSDLGTAPTASSSTFTTSINARPADGQIYRFTPNVAPSGSSSQVFCASTSPTIASLAATGTAIRWYGVAVGGSELASSTPLVNGTQYYATQTIGGCESSTRLNVTVTLSPVAVITPATCSNGSDGAIAISGLNTPIEFKKTDNDYIDLGSAFLSNRSAFTVEGWIKFNLSDVGARMSLFGQNDVIEFFLDSGSNVIQLYTAGGGSVTTPLIAAGIGNNAWHHIAATGDGTNTKLYIDGVLKATGGSATLNYGSSTTYSAKIGSGVVDPVGTSGGGFTGQIQKVGFYSSALSSGAITSLATIPTRYLGTETGLIAGYNFLEATGTTLNSLPTGKNGTFVNTPEWKDYTYSWTKTGTPAYIAATKNISGLSPGTYHLAFNGVSCSPTTYTVSSLNSAPATPLIGAITQPNCVTTTGSVSFSGLPATGTWTITANPATAGLTGISGTGETTTIGGLNPGTNYTFIVSNGSCTSSPTANVPTDALITTTYTGSSWSTTPDLTMIGIINSNTPITSDVELCNCTVNSTNANIATGVTLKLQDKLTVNGTAKLTFENNASLVQINDVVNSGNITYKRETVTSIDKFDFTYWSSPVFPQTLYDVSPNTLLDKYMSFDAVTNDWFSENSITKVMERGVGYSIRGPQNHYPPNPIGTYRANFIGVPNNGTIRVPITATDANYLLGNPYPSALDATAFLNGNAGVLDGTIYFWTHNTDIAPSGSLYMYSSDDYATYNLTGGTAVADSDPDKSPTNPHKPTGKIASGQGFFATGIAAGDVVFKNTMRVGVDGNTGDNTQFFRTKNTKSKIASTIEKNRVWLNLTNTKGAFKQILVGYVTGATNEYDSSYDGYSFSLNAYIDFYSFLGNDAMAIQGRALPFNDSDAVPLGYSSTIAGSFSISIDELDGTMQSQNVFLEDKMQNVVHNLKGSPYTFTTGIGTFDNRFVLRYTDKTLGNTDFERVNSSVVVSKDKNELKIKSEIETIKRVTVYDLLGKKVFEKEAVNSTEFRSSSIGFSQQIGIVKVTLDNGQVISKKVIF